MKIAVFTDSYKPYVSGVVRSIDTFGAQLLALGHQVYVFGPRYYGNSEDPRRTDPLANWRHKIQLPWQPLTKDEHASPPDLLDGGSVEDVRPSGDGRPAANKVYRFWSIPVPMYRGFTAPVPISATADELLAQLGVDIIHSHTPFAMGTLGATLARRRRLPLVFTHHTMYHEYVHYLPGVRSVLQQMMLRYVATYCRRADLVIVPTPNIKDFVVREYEMPSAHVVAIPTGIELDDFAAGDGAVVRQRFGIGAKERVLSFVGRLGLEKNVGFLLRMLVRVRQRLPHVHLILVGDGPEREPLLRAAGELGVAGHLHLTGTLSKADVNHVFHGSDLFVIASTSETQGLATLEAMATGLPVVGVDAPGTKDMVEHGRQGLLTAEDVPAFADAVVTLLKDEQRLRRYGRAAKARAESFSAANMTARLVAAYEEVLARPRAGVTSRDSAAAME